MPIVLVSVDSVGPELRSRICIQNPNDNASRTEGPGSLPSIWDEQLGRALGCRFTLRRENLAVLVSW